MTAVLSGMPTTQAIIDAVERYLRAVATGSAADIAACYAENATLEDPVGSPPLRGRAAIETFYAAIEQARRHTKLIAIRVAGGSAAFHFLVRTEHAGHVAEVEPIDVMSFDEQAQITGMRAFWSPTDVRTGG